MILSAWPTVITRARRTIGLMRASTLLSPFLTIASLVQYVELNRSSIPPLVPTEEKDAIRMSGQKITLSHQRKLRNMVKFLCIFHSY